MRKRRVIIVSTVVLFLAAPCAAAILYWAFLPYPWALRQQARAATQFDPQWKIPQSEFAEILREVRSHLEFYEFISRVEVTPATITITTTTSFSGPLASAGRTFHFQKQNGRWEAGIPGYWVS